MFNVNIEHNYILGSKWKKNKLKWIKGAKLLKWICLVWHYFNSINENQDDIWTKLSMYSFSLEQIYPTIYTQNISQDFYSE